MNTLREAYEAGFPLISDTEYNALEKLYGQELGAAGDVPHRFRMWSLNKHYARDGEIPLNINQCVETPKLDGSAVDLFYVNGELVQSLTRGDGHKGNCILRNMKHLAPTKISNEQCVAQITGEVVALSSIKNSRNYASGAINLKDEEEFLDRVNEGGMVFVAYSIQVIDEASGVTESYSRDMSILADIGFVVITEFDHELYPKDGTVYRINDNRNYNDAGFTSKFPKGAIAVKDTEDEYVTKLRSVIWETGKSGKVTPVGIFDPVDTGDAVLRRATLNNPGYIEALGLELDCDIVVVRAGDIIPRIVRRAD